MSGNFQRRQQQSVAALIPYKATAESGVRKAERMVGSRSAEHFPELKTGVWPQLEREPQIPEGKGLESALES